MAGSCAQSMNDKCAGSPIFRVSTQHPPNEVVQGPLNSNFSPTEPNIPELQQEEVHYSVSNTPVQTTGSRGIEGRAKQELFGIGRSRIFKVEVTGPILNLEFQVPTPHLSRQAIKTSVNRRGTLLLSA